MNWIKFMVATCAGFSVFGVLYIIATVVSYMTDKEDASPKLAPALKNKLVIRLLISVPITVLLIATAVGIQ